MAACLAHERLTGEQLPLAASAVRAFNLHLYYEIRGRKSRQNRPSGDELRDHAKQSPANR
jgi:hypothetical protein